MLDEWFNAVLVNPSPFTDCLLKMLPRKANRP